MNTTNLLRKIHIYAGLGFFLPVFLFSASGFMLNHRWGPWNNFADWAETEEEIHVIIPQTGTTLDKAKAILDKLNAAGEINTLEYKPENDLIHIRTTRPGQYLDINLSLSTGNGTIKTIETNAWSLLNNMHTHAGLHSNIPDKKNWLWTKVWSLMMDLTAAAMLTLLGTGIYMWTGLKKERRWGLAALETGGVILIFVMFMMIK